MADWLLIAAAVGLELLSSVFTQTGLLILLLLLQWGTMRYLMESRQREEMFLDEIAGRQKEIVERLDEIVERLHEADDSSLSGQ